MAETFKWLANNAVVFHVWSSRRVNAPITWQLQAGRFQGELRAKARNCQKSTAEQFRTIRGCGEAGTEGDGSID